MKLAHSAKPRLGVPAQSYRAHVKGTCKLAEGIIDNLSSVLPESTLSALRAVILPAARFHDLGKLEKSNQSVLRGEVFSETLPICHSDAGTCLLLGRSLIWSAIMVSSHHVGLPNIVDEAARGKDAFLSSEERRNPEIANLAELLHEHQAELDGMELDFLAKKDFELSKSEYDKAVFMRMAQSILADADYTDTAHRGIAAGHDFRPVPGLLPRQRLEILNAYVSKLPPDGTMSEMRRAIYASASKSGQNCLAHIESCDSPVGSGKTTAIMAHMLERAIRKNASRIFIVLPFISIIEQSAEVYRKALVLPGEKPDEVVAEVHHLADFSSEETKSLSVQWNTPIIVTTAAAFFESIASNRPSTLRKLHNLIGSIVFVDEAHAALPQHLLPIVLKWMCSCEKDWSVQWILASGSLVKFWNVKAILDVIPGVDIPKIAPVVDDITRTKSQSIDTGRASIIPILDPGNPKRLQRLSFDELVDKVHESKGPRLVIFNTIKSAASAARKFQSSGLFSKTFHLSTAIISADRKKTIHQVKKALHDDPNGNWVLIGTSCVEAGLDFDFATVFRECASVMSIIQANGRNNRNNMRKDAITCVFAISWDEQPFFEHNRMIDNDIMVTQAFISKGIPITSELSTEAFRQQLLRNEEDKKKMNELVECENRLSFKTVDEKFQVIESNKKTVIVEQEIIEQIKNNQPIDWKDIQNHSVQISKKYIDQYQVPEFDRFPELYEWPLEYSPFLGYMEGIIKDIETTE